MRALRLTDLSDRDAVGRYNRPSQSARPIGPSNRPVRSAQIMRAPAQFDLVYSIAFIRSCLFDLG